jgi:exodeoxyribonuclease VII large subunit
MGEIDVNIPQYTVAEISDAVKRALETEFGWVRVRGEITEFKRYASGHLYFSLKDKGGKLAVVAWKAVVPRLGMVPENGVEVIATGRITTYGDRSTYQLIVERLNYAGEGAALARIEALRKRLAAEGLFEAARKRALPILPRVIGVITSAEGAVIQDIRITVARRFRRPVLLWAVPVQGDDAAARIAAAIARFATLPLDGPIPRPDVLIVARGGGSLEDLMAFNDEAVVRAAAASPIPLIAAVGHETDTTLIDFAADRRAPTPTAAAEMAIPVRAELVANLAHREARLGGAFQRIVQERRLRLERAERGLPDLQGFLGTVRQRLDDRIERLGLALPVLVQTRRRGLELATARLVHPRAVIAAARARLQLVWTRLGAGLVRLVAARRGAAREMAGRLSPALLAAQLREVRARLDGTGARLDALSAEAVLARGYALVFDERGRLLTRARQIVPGLAFRLRLSDGTINARAENRHDRQGLLPL